MADSSGETLKRGPSLFEEFKETERALTALLRMGGKLNSASDLDSLLDALVEELLELTGAESGCAGLRTPQGMSCDHFFQGLRIVPLSYHCAPGVGWAGWLITHGTHYRTNDAAHDPLIVPAVRERLGVRSGMGIPIVDSEKDVIAFFEVYNKRSGEGFTEADVRNSLAAAQIGSLAIHNRLMEQKLRRIRFLEESERVQNAVLSAIAHDVRAPLAAITTSLSGLLTSGGTLDQAAERHLLETADFEARRLHRLVNNLLSLTRLETGVSTVKTEPCDLSDVLGAALEEMGASARQRQVSIDIPQDLPLIPMDFGLITSVLVNLLSNTFKYSPPDRPVKVRGTISDDQLEVLVIDRGVGIPPEDLDRVFDKFYRVAEFGSTNGLGLGLAICKGFIEAHGGRIRLENNPAGGIIARFVIPLHPAADA